MVFIGKDLKLTPAGNVRPRGLAQEGEKKLSSPIKYISTNIQPNQSPSALNEIKKESILNFNQHDSGAVQEIENKPRSNNLNQEVEHMLQSGLFENEAQVLKYLEEHQVVLEDQPTEILVELAERLKASRDERYSDEEVNV